MVMIVIKATIAHFWLKSKIYLKRVPVMAKCTLAQTINFVNISFFRYIYYLYKHSSKETYG